MITIEDIEAAMREEGSHLFSVSFSRHAPRVVVNVRETQFRWRYGKPCATLRDAILQQFPQLAENETQGDDLEGLLG